MAQEIRKFAYIDAVRAIAILMVIALHASQHVEGSSLVAKSALFGQLGVQLFFVASALTLCLSAESRKDEPNGLRNFYIRRLFRIAPVYYLGIAFYSCWTILTLKYQIGPLDSIDQFTAKNILANVFFVHGFVPTANNNIVPGGWSIGTEIAFYALFPLLFRAMARLKSPGLAAVCGTGLSLIAMPYAETMYGIVFQNDNFLYFNILTQINVFTVGMAYYFVTRDGAKLWMRPELALLCFGFVTVMLSVQGYFFWVPFFSAIAFVALTEVVKSAPQSMLSPLLVPIGRASFSMYVGHFFVLSVLDFFVMKRIGLQRFLGANITLLLFFVASVGITWAIAQISYRWIEQPMIKLGARLVASRAPERVPSH